MKNTNYMLSQQKSNATSIRTWIAITLSVVFVLGLGLWFKPLFSEKIAEASNLNSLPEAHLLSEVEMVDSVQEPTSPSMKTPTTLEEFEEDPVLSTQTGPFTQNVNGIEVIAKNFRRDNKGVAVDVCYPLLDTSDWLLENVILQYGDVEVSDYYGELIEIQEASSQGEIGFRCDTLSFDVPSHADLSKVILIIDSFSTYPREGEECVAYMNKLQDKLEANGVEAQCTYEDWGPSLTIVSKPAAMSQEEAEEVISLGELFLTTGPWVFSFTLEQ